ncbi:hypothetical protein ACFL35_13955 [Candidatus Riflebacteria bacterium]
MKRANFTLTEIVIMSGVAMLLFFGISKVLTHVLKGARHGMEKLEALHDLAFFLGHFRDDLRNSTEIENLDSQTITINTNRFDKSEQKKINLQVTYKLLKSGKNINGIKEIPSDSRFKKRTYFQKNIFSFAFKKLDSLPGKRFGLAIKLKIRNSRTGGKMDFERHFFPPRFKENRLEDTYKPLGESG